MPPLPASPQHAHEHEEDFQLALGQPGRQLARSPLHAVACGSDLACGSFRVEPPLLGAAPHGETLGVVLAAELRRLGPTFVPGFLKDRRDLGVGDEVLPALLIPVEEHPDPVVLIGIAKDGRTLGPVLPSLPAPLVEKIFTKRSKSSTFVVARINSLLLCSPRRRRSTLMVRRV